LRDLVHSDAKFLSRNIGVLFGNGRVEFSCHDTLGISPFFLRASNVHRFCFDHSYYFQLSSLNHLFALRIVDIQIELSLSFCVCQVTWKASTNRSRACLIIQCSFGLTSCFLGNSLLSWWITCSDFGYFRNRI
jgi:hypothetical protein